MLVVVSALDPEFKNSDVFIAFITAFSRCYGSVRFSSYDATRTNMFINKSTKLICQGFTGKQVFTVVTVIFCEWFCLVLMLLTAFTLTFALKSEVII